MIGQTIAHYKILEHLGAGGMGEVYLAVDSKLDRKVALKFLPAQMTAQPDARARFLQEARAASALNHPNICTIHDIQEHDGQLFIVMEHVDGQTLRDKRATLSPKQVLEIGAQVADGLAAAHEHGIVHRDIKPENIMIRKDGIVQIMDFGLAKLHGATRLTKEGSTIGTAGYMSPEQVQGLDTDHRSDIFSLGVVLYELLTDQMPFKGMHDTAIMYEIVNIDAAPPSAIRPDIEPELDRILLECLDKDKDERYQSAKELAKDLRRFRRSSDRSKISRVSTVRPVLSTSDRSRQTPSSALAPAPPSPSKSGGLMGWIVAAALALAAVGIAWVHFSAAPPTERVFRFSVGAPEGFGLNVAGANNLAISPDGKRLAMVAADSAQATSLWVRALDALTPQRLPGTESARFPFWSPDSRFIGFFSEGKLKKIDVTGGPAITLCDAAEGRGGTWSKDGVIVFAPNANTGLFRVPSSGGVPVSLTTLLTDRGQTTHRFPWFLPDGNQFLYFIRIGTGQGDTADDSVWVGSLDGAVNKVLCQSATNCCFANGYFFNLRERTLMAQPFDAKSGTFIGDPTPIAEEVFDAPGFSTMAASVSAEGILAYQTGEGSNGSRLFWYDRTGQIVDTVGDRTFYGNCALSPDGKKFAVEETDPVAKNTDVWIWDLTRTIRTRLTFSATADGYPAWSADGSRVYYSSARASDEDIMLKSATGADSARIVLEATKSQWVMDVSLDGRWLVYIEPGVTGSGDDLWILPLSPDGSKGGEPYAFQQTQFDDDDARFSPDGRWVAYGCDETGEFEIYVRPVSGQGGKWQISSAGGDLPTWRRDGRELFYISNTNDLMAVEVNGEGESFVVGQPKALFSVGIPAVGVNKPYDASPDGQRFIVASVERGVAAAQINLIVNWNTELIKK